MTGKMLVVMRVWWLNCFMDSTFLIKNSFKEFGQLDINEARNRQNEINFSGIYVFVLNKKFPRLDGETDILYIGQSGQRTGRPIYKRMMDYLRAYESAPQDKRIGDSLYKIKTKVRIGATLKDKKIDNSVTLFIKKVEPHNNCKKEESKLLGQYYNDHLELPPLNRSH
jgi:hypothetical protein